MSYALWLIALSAAFVALERLWPRRPDQGLLRAGLATDAVYVVFNGHFLGVLLAALTTPVRGRFEAAATHLGAAPALHLSIAAPLNAGAQFAIALVGIDLLKWGIHNLLHRVPWLWEMHKVHHSIERMDWLGSMRFHFGEAIFYDALLYVPLAMLGFRGDVLFALAVVGTAIGHFNHANLRWRIGPLRYVINSPEMHIWHHARDGETLRNFGVNLAVWDWLFGTAWLPDHPPARLGFDGIEAFPRDPIGQTLWPLRRWASDALSRARAFARPG
jgi:sterol desaturase/sphingolipid hydroxylase (fatty acid hydroxylase superfamily)